MIAPVPETYSGRIIELGAGNGALTLRLAARCPKARILACEINPVLARKTRDNLDRAGINGRVEVISDSAEHLLSEMGRRGMDKVDYVLSGIPLGNLPGEQALALIDAISRALRPGGMYIQFQYSLIDRKRIRSRFSILRTARCCSTSRPQSCTTRRSNPRPCARKRVCGLGASASIP